MQQMSNSSQSSSFVPRTLPFIRCCAHTKVYSSQMFSNLSTFQPNITNVKNSSLNVYWQIICAKHMSTVFMTHPHIYLFNYDSYTTLQSFNLPNLQKLLQLGQTSQKWTLQIVAAELFTGKALATALWNVNITINCFNSAVFSVVLLSVRKGAWCHLGTWQGWMSQQMSAEFLHQFLRVIGKGGRTSSPLLVGHN